MGYFPVRYDSIVVTYECKMFIRLATAVGRIGKQLLLCEGRGLMFTRNIQQKFGGWSPDLVVMGGDSCPEDILRLFENI